MPNLVGIGNSQVPTNAMLGGLAYQDSVDIEVIPKIKARTADTAVDIFVYDTRKDSDGGAWRYRTKSLSWYNEGASATRGARKEFPAVAVIVMESTQCTIYDADDPNLSMWMVFNFGAGNTIGQKTMFYAGGRAVFALNGMICFGGDDGWKDGLTQVKLLEDTAVWRNDSYINYWSTSIADRNKTNNWGEFVDDPKYELKPSGGMAQLVMTVLDNAPINPNTGLPQPTVVCSTRTGSGGVQIVTALDDDFIGVVFRRTGHGYPSAMRIDVDGNKLVVTHNGPTSGNAAETFNLDTMSQLGDGVEGPGHGDNSLSSSETYYGYGNILSGNTHMPFKTRNFGNTVRPAVNGDDIYFGYNYLHHIREHEDPMLAMTNEIEEDYNTGWMPANCKRCLLASTDSTDLGGGNKVSNGFDWSGAQSTQNSTPPTGWTGGNGATFAVETGNGANGNYIRLYNENNGGAGPNSYMYQAITTVAGKKYKYSGVQIHRATITVYLRIGTSAGGNELGGSQFTSSSSNTPRQVFGTFTATGTTTYVSLGIISGTHNYTVGWDDVVVSEVDDDRSINLNGFHSHGDIPKNPVAAGAELMAYGPFASNTDMLVQGYSSDLDYGTGDFYYMIWMNISSHSGLQGIWSRQENGQSSGNRIQFQTVAGGNGQLAFYGGTASGNIAGLVVQLNTWEHVAMVRRGGRMYWYLNGISIFDKGRGYADTTNYSNTDAVLRVGGLSLTNTSAFVQGAYCMTAGKLALFKTGAEAPTDQQIMEIYQDEKKMFAPNAKCNLGSTNPYVRALEYDKDTDTLHVGTDVGRSDFNGLVRINTTSTPVTTVISASNGLIAEQ